MLKNKKSAKVLLKILCIILTFTFLTAGAVFAEEKPITVLIDGEQVEFDAQPVMKNDRVMVPMRKVFEKLGAEVLWDPFFERVIVNYNEDDQIIMYINYEEIFRNGVQMKVDAAPFISEGRTYVPLRFISESFGMSVEWSDSAQTVYIVPEYKGMQYIPFGEFLSIPSPYSVNRNYKTLEYENTGDVATAKYSLNGENTSDFERYALIMKAAGFETVKQASEEDSLTVYYGKGMVIKQMLLEDGETFTISITSDSTGESIKEYLESEEE
ncbi:MAG: copper amine oxidase N-terminal domain-containing protein [Clostridia bacterium]|nr:copper amine oxidase N-terminal domain-containing protein [Clostridia bacterium]